MSPGSKNSICFYVFLVCRDLNQTEINFLGFNGTVGKSGDGVANCFGLVFKKKPGGLGAN